MITLMLAVIIAYSLIGVSYFRLQKQNEKLYRLMKTMTKELNIEEPKNPKWVKYENPKIGKPRVINRTEFDEYEREVPPGKRSRIL